MSRKMRRAMQSGGRRASADAQVFQRVATEMAQRAPEILGGLRDAVGGEPTSGHTVDALMNSAVRVERALVACDPKGFVVAAAEVLFLARHLAIREGKIAVAAAQPGGQA